jgi:hypothetical protein
MMMGRVSKTREKDYDVVFVGCFDDDDDDDDE